MMPSKKKIAATRIKHGGKGHYDLQTGLYTEDEPPTIFEEGDEVKGLSDDEMASLAEAGALVGTETPSGASTAALLEPEVMTEAPTESEGSEA